MVNVNNDSIINYFILHSYNYVFFSPNNKDVLGLTYEILSQLFFSVLNLILVSLTKIRTRVGTSLCPCLIRLVLPPSLPCPLISTWIIQLLIVLLIT